MKKILVMLGVVFFGTYVLAGQDLFYQSLVKVDANPYFMPFEGASPLGTDSPAIMKAQQLPENFEDSKVFQHFLDWTALRYFLSSDKPLNLTDKDNSVLAPSLIQDEQSRILRSQVYKDLLSIIIDSELTVKRLSFLNTDFRNLLFQNLYHKDLIQFVMTLGKMRLYCLISFKGEGGLIDLFVKSRFYNKDENLTPVTDGPYIPSPYKSLVIEARGMKITPALFPKIYTRDVDGSLRLIYSFSMSSKTHIIQNGYANYITSEQNVVKDTSNFYTTAIGTRGESKTDIIISRESYLQFFSSAQSIHNLQTGNLTIIVDNNNEG